MSNHKPASALEANLRLVIHQIEKINLEIDQRKTLSEKILAKLKEQLETYYSVRNNPTALLDHSSGQGYLKDREHVNHLIRETKRQSRIEERSCFNDLQKLQWEKRNLERKKAELEFNLSLMKKDNTG